MLGRFELPTFCLEGRYSIQLSYSTQLYRRWDLNSHVFFKTTDFKSVAYYQFRHFGLFYLDILYHKRKSLSRKLPYLFCLFASENRSSAIGEGVTVMWLLWCFFQGTTEKHLYFSHTNFKLARHRISTDHSWTRFNLNASFERHFHSWKTSICKLILSTQ